MFHIWLKKTCLFLCNQFKGLNVKKNSQVLIFHKKLLLASTTISISCATSINHIQINPQHLNNQCICSMFILYNLFLFCSCQTCKQHHFNINHVCILFYFIMLKIYSHTMSLWRHIWQIIFYDTTQLAQKDDSLHFFLHLLHGEM